MTALVVTYPSRDGATFDRDYYVTTHMQIVRDAWTKHGLRRTTALMPDEAKPAYAAIAVLEFEDSAAVDRCLGSPEAAAVFADIVNFTDIPPVPMRCA